MNDLTPNSYRVIYADPPWRFSNFSQKGEGRNAVAHYECMSFDDLRSVDVASLAAKDCVLFVLATSQLKDSLREQLRPTGRNLQILANRHDDHFSQLCRNLKSHNTLERKGLANFRQGRFYITVRGRQYAELNEAIFDAALKQAFPVAQRQRLARRDYEHAVIEEGQVTRLPRQVYQRSRLLSEFARLHFCR